MSDEEKIEELRNALQRCINVLQSLGRGGDSVTTSAVEVLEETT